MKGPDPEHFAADSTPPEPATSVSDLARPLNGSRHKTSADGNTLKTCKRKATSNVVKTNNPNSERVTRFRKVPVHRELARPIDGIPCALIAVLGVPFDSRVEDAIRLWQRNIGTIFQEWMS